MTLTFPAIFRPPTAGHSMLCEVRCRREWKVLSLHCPPPLRSALHAHGIEPGSRLQVVHNDHRGTLAIQMPSGRVLILGRQFTYHTRVQAVSRARVIPFPVLVPSRHSLNAVHSS